ncbi:hypothetical protein VNO77_44608 [Canavalia gladiata]|uniref:Uncharacterized protein n=1 Tax=Canavalia gladiata TaxID=3824 RepID=A0AAN9JYE0_CANGL
MYLLTHAHDERKASENLSRFIVPDQPFVVVSRFSGGSTFAGFTTVSNSSFEIATLVWSSSLDAGTEVSLRDEATGAAGDEELLSQGEVRRRRSLAARQSTAKAAGSSAARIRSISL